MSSVSRQRVKRKWKVRCFVMSWRKYTNYIFGDMYSRAATETNEGQDEEDIDIQETTAIDHDEDVYFSLVNPEEVAYHSNITGVKVWSRARLRGQKRRRAVRSESAIVDAETAILENIKDVFDDYIVIYNPLMLSCPKCDKPYRKQQCLDFHISTCSGLSTGSTVLDRASKLAFKMFGTSNAPVYTTKNLHPAALCIEISIETIGSCTLLPRWAQPPKHVETLGQNYTSHYAEELDAWFTAGEEEKGKRMSAARMRELLKLKYPHHYDIPGEHNLASYISILVRRKKQCIDNNDVMMGSVVIRRGMNRQYKEQLELIVLANPNLMPRMARAALIEGCN